MLVSDTEKYYKPLARCDLFSSPRLALTSLHERIYCLVYAHLSYVSIIFFLKKRHRHYLGTAFRPKRASLRQSGKT